MTPGTDPDRSDWPLEPDQAELRSWFETCSELMLTNLAEVSSQPASGVVGPLPDHDELKQDLPEQGADLNELMRKVVEEYVPYSFNAASPGYMAYIPGGGIVPSALADLISDITNRYIGVGAAAPLLVRIEFRVLRWFLDWVGYPPEARGVLTSGGSIANLIALVCGRHKLLGPRFDDGVIYVSDQIHHSISKAARFIGFRDDQVRWIEAGDDLRLRPEQVAAAIQEDRRAGLRPALLVASAGTTNTGVVDDLDGLADLAREEGLWYHVDAAYGGFFMLTERGRRTLDGIGKADSVTMDPHKSLFLPYGTGCLLVKNGEDLNRPHASDTGYLPAFQDQPDTQDFCEYSPELSRDFRGLRIWLPLRCFGARAFREALDEKLDLAAHLAVALEEIPGIRVLAAPDLSLVAFRYEAGPEEGREEQNQELERRVLAHREIWMSGSRVRGEYVLRLCVLHFRTHRQQVDRAVELIRLEAARLAAPFDPGS